MCLCEQLCSICAGLGCYGDQLRFLLKVATNRTKTKLNVAEASEETVVVCCGGHVHIRASSPPFCRLLGGVPGSCSLLRSLTELFSPGGAFVFRRVKLALASTSCSGAGTREENRVTRACPAV